MTAAPERTMLVDWRQAECKGENPELFFPEQEGSPGLAKQICGMCPITDDCRKYAVRRPWLYGIWGGTTQAERQRNTTVGGNK